MKRTTTIGQRKRNQQDQPENTRSLITNETDDFIAKEEKEVIKVPNCTYCNETKSNAKYYLCLCSTSAKGFEPICEACAKTCHKEHNPSLEVPGANLCCCGRDNHLVTPEMKAMFARKQKDNNEQGGLCFFSKFFKVISNKGYYRYGTKEYCSVCVQYCLKKKFDDESLTFLDNDRTKPYSCSCMTSHEINVIKLNADFFTKKEFHRHLREINFNIIFRIPQSKELYIDTLTQELNNYLIKKNEEMNLEFFQNILVYKILELFSMFSFYWENKFWYVLPSLFKDKNINDLLGLLSIGDIINKLTEENVTNFISGKFYFAELLFDYIVRTYTNTYCNLLNFNTVLNMDIYQRLIYIHQLRVFHLYNAKPLQVSFLDSLSIYVVELYDNILKINERFPSIFIKVISYVFPTFNRIMKYCIKYNLITEETRKKYFSLVYETLQIQHERKVGSLRDSCFYILKSILYTIIYNNDQICFDYIQGKDSRDLKKFMFCISEDSLSLTKILLLIIEEYDRTEDPLRSIIFDNFLKKTYELLLNKNDFYMNAVANLDKWEIKFISKWKFCNLSNASPIDLETLKQDINKFVQNMNQSCYKEVSQFCEEMRKVNRCYFELEIEQEKYFEIVNVHMTNFNKFISNEGFNKKEMWTSFCCYQNPPREYNHKLNALKQVIFYSTFFQRIEEFCHIYTASKKYSFPKEENYDKKLLNENIRQLLEFIFVLVIRDYKFLTLIMNIKPIIFATTFNDVFDTLEVFLSRVVEMIYSPVLKNRAGSYVNYSEKKEESIEKGSIISNINLDQEKNEEEEGDEKIYLFDNYCSICEIIVELVKLNGLNLDILSDLMRLSNKFLKLINIKNIEYLNIIEAFVDIFAKIKEDKSTMEELDHYIDSLNDKGREKNKKISYFIYSYFDFLCELYECDANFAGCLEKAEIIDRAKFEQVVNELFLNKFDGVPIEVQYSLCRYFFTIKNPLNFKIDTITEQLKNLYMEGVDNNISIMHLSKKLLLEKNTSKEVEILDIARKITEIYLIFDVQKIKDYNNPKDICFMLKYYEYLILRPLYSAFNMLILNIQSVKGKDVFIFYQAVFYFFKLTIDFYNCTKNPTKAKISDKIVYGFHEFIVHPEIPKVKLEKINEYALKFQNNNIVYFEIEKIYNIFIESMEIILRYNKPNTNSSASSISINPEGEGKNDLLKENTYIGKRDKLLEIYREAKENFYDDNLSLVKSYLNVKEELEYDGAIPIINYLIQKLFDPLNQYNKKFLKPKEYAKLLKNNENLITSYQFQNSYALIYLCCFFYNDSSDFQNAFKEYDKLPSNFYEFIFVKIIFSIVLNEIKKINDLDYLEENRTEPRNIGKKETIAASTGRYAITFIQNLCEGHNKENQTKFFTMELDYNEYLKNNKNIYIDRRHNLQYKNYLNLISRKNIDIQRDSISSQKSGSSAGEVSPSKDLQKPKEDKQAISALPIKNIAQKTIESKDEDKKAKQTIGSRASITTANEDDNEAEKEKSLEHFGLSYFNLICYLMEIINDNLHSGTSLDCKLFKNMNKLKNFENVTELYSKLSDLIIEMIQGTETKNFDRFYQNSLPKEYQYFTEEGTYTSNKVHKIYIFLELTNQIKQIIFNKELAFDSLSYAMKSYLFNTMNNILSQDNLDPSVIKSFSSIFPPDDLLGIISLYLRGIYLSHICHLLYSYDDFFKELNYLELDTNMLKELKSYFKENPHIYRDKYFQLAAQMFLFLTVLAEKYNVNEAEKIKKYAERKLIESKVQQAKGNDEEEPQSLMEKVSSMISVGNITVKTKKVKPNDHNYVNDKIIAVQFFTKIIKKCEFKVDSDGDNTLDLKTIYFICNPHYYYISKTTKSNFLNDVDRSSPTQKLKSLIEILDVFQAEIEYKKELYKRSRSLLALLGMINYQHVDFYNFCISLVINTILVIYLQDENENSPNIRLINTLIRIIVLLQIIMNVIFLYLFYISKHGFYVLLSLNKFDKDHELTLKEKINVYVLDSFLFNDETYLMILIIIMGLCGVLTEYGAFLFALQLLSVVKFIDTIKEILLAFKIRFTQLLAIIGFLVILIYFYASFGFFYLIEEFNVSADGKVDNFCQTLFECTVNYFNHGVRAGGGIGDLLENKDYTEERGLYYLRFFNDLIFYITVILLLLNMINGVIVTTFSQIREESSKKEEDQQNRCFICNIDRIEFQKNKIDFEEHKKYEHNFNNYIKFFIYLSKVNEKDMDADQSFIHDCIKDEDIKFFPVNCAGSIGEIDPNEESD